MKYRKKQVVIEAFQIGFDVVPQWFMDRVGKDVETKNAEHSFVCFIKTIEGEMFAGYGDWIIKGVKDELYPCKADIFEMTYEAVL